MARSLSVSANALPVPQAQAQHLACIKDIFPVLLDLPKGLVVSYYAGPYLATAVASTAAVIAVAGLAVVKQLI